MQTKEHIGRYKALIAESFASLSVGLWTVSLIGYLHSGISWMTYLLSILGVISVLLSFYLILPWNLKQKSVFEFLERNGVTRAVKLLIWLTVLATFGVFLLQTEIIWLVVIGLTTVIIAFIVFDIGILTMNKDNRKTNI